MKSQCYDRKEQYKDMAFQELKAHFFLQLKDAGSVFAD
jgi:hypothetical protein